MKIQYSQNLPAIDFDDFVETFVGSEIQIKDVLASITGDNKFADNMTKFELYELVWNEAMKYVGKFLKHWNGWTWQWYIDQFLKTYGIELRKEGYYHILYINGEKNGNDK